LGNKLRGWLTQHILVIAQNLAPEGEISKSSLVASTEVESPALKPSVSDNEVSSQIIELLPRFNAAVKAGSEFDIGDENQLKEFDVARLHLLTSTWMSRRYTKDIIGVHETNLIYKHREAFVSTSMEFAELLRSMIGHPGDVVPGWFWIRELPIEQIAAWLLELANTDPLESVRIRALTLLAKANIHIAPETWNGLPFRDDNWMVRNAAYDYLAQIGDERALSLFTSEDEDKALSTAKDAKLKLLARIAPTKAVAEFLEGDNFFPKEVTATIVGILSAVDDEMLNTALLASDPSIRNMAVKELTARGALSSVQASDLLSDPDLSVRANALLALVKYREMPTVDKVRDLLKAEKKDEGLFGLSFGLSGGAELPEDKIDNVLVAYFRTKDPNELKDEIDWYSLEGSLAYKALALEYFDEYAETIRSDLRTGFARVKEESTDRFRSAFGEEHVPLLLSKWEPLQSFICSQFCGAALSALLEKGNPSDASIARLHLSDESFHIKSLVIALLSKYGTTNDVFYLIDEAKTGWGPWRQNAVTAALKYSGDPTALALELIESTKTEVSAPALASLIF
jgi:hypothetical protein